MNIDNIEIVPIEHSSTDFAQYKVDRFIHKFDYYDHLPDDYLTLNERFGEGIFADYIRIFPPYRAIKLNNYWKKLEEGNNCGVRYVANKYTDDPTEFILKSVLIGDTLDGDQIIFFNGQYYIYHFQFSNYFTKVGVNIVSVFEYYERGEKWESIEIKTFTPFNSQLVNGSIGYITNADIP